MPSWLKAQMNVNSGQDVVAAVGQVLGIGDAQPVGAGGHHAAEEAGDQQSHDDHHRGHQAGSECSRPPCPWPSESFSSPRMLKAAMTNTHISSQKTIVPTIAGTLRSMPMCCIDSASPLRSAATCRPTFSLRMVNNRARQPGDDVADDEDDDHRQTT